MARRVLASMMVIIALLASTGGCSGARIAHPRTKEEFAEAFTTAFESGDRQTIASWIKWGDVPSELRERYLGFYTAFAGRNKVVSLDIEPYDETFLDEMNQEKQKLHFSLKPVYWCRIETRGNAGFEGGLSESSWESALGYEDGLLYFCGPTMDFSEWRRLHRRIEGRHDSDSDHRKADE